MNYNQSDPIYKQVMLGFSKKYSLFSDGCYVFSLAYMLGVDPVDCNNRLKEVGAFMANSEGDVCLLNHNKIAIAFPDKIASVSKYDSYDNEACLDAIEENGMCIVKVDFDGTNSTTMDTHFLNFIGNKKCFDSLGGKVKPTSTYPILRGLRVVNLKKNVPVETSYKGLDFTNIESMKVAVDAWASIRDGQYILKTEYDKVINEGKDREVTLAQQYEKEKQPLADKIRVLESALSELQKAEHSWGDQADTYQRKLKAIVEKLYQFSVTVSPENEEDILVGGVQSAINFAVSKALKDAQPIEPTPKPDPNLVAEFTVGKFVVRLYRQGL